ncbi:MAG TPA: hypothetical protein VK335_21730 [Bryobacteraceae bacterium]|nr:hypothetical protein [Bryobacteraceae bacterium]
MQKWLLASLTLGLLAGQAFAACDGEGPRNVLFNCGGGCTIHRGVCTGIGGVHCNPTALKVLCCNGSSYTSANSCIPTSAELQRFQPDGGVQPNLLANQKSTLVVGTCGAYNGQFEQWLQSHPSVVSARAQLPRAAQ